VPIAFSKVRSKKKKDKNGRKIKKSEGAEALRGMQDITLKDTSNFVLWEYSVRRHRRALSPLNPHRPGR